MAGTVVVTEELVGNVKKVKFAWTASAGGAADGVTTNYYNGAIQRLVTVPDGGVAPTNLYDIVINDDDGTDVLMGGGANRSNTATEQVLASSLGVVANDLLTIAVTNAGNGGKGVTYVYIR